MQRKRYKSHIGQSGIISSESIEQILDSAMMVRVVPVENGERRGVRMIAELALHKLTFDDRANLVPVLDRCLDYVPDHRDAMHFYTHATSLPFSQKALEDKNVRREAIAMLRRSVTQDILTASRELRRELNGAMDSTATPSKERGFSLSGIGRALTAFAGRAPRPAIAGMSGP